MKTNNLVWMFRSRCCSCNHKYLTFVDRLCKLRMFEDDMGSFMVMFLASLIVLFVFSWIYNAFLLIGGSDTENYRISDLMGISNSLFMKMAATGTWCGDFFTAWMVIIETLKNWLSETEQSQYRAFEFVSHIYFHVIWYKISISFLAHLCYLIF